MTHQATVTSTLNTLAPAVGKKITSLQSRRELGDVAMVTLTAATASSRPRDPQLIIRVKTPSRHTLKDTQIHVFKGRIQFTNMTVLTHTESEPGKDLARPIGATVRL